MNVRSAAEDLTTPARIREAAIALFGRQGFERTTVRAVATEVGVSPALVIHHFGTKARLRESCDAAVVEEFLGQADEIAGADLTAAMAHWLADLDRFRPSIDYLARSLQDDTPIADRLFDALLRGTADMLADQAEAGVMHPSSDPEVRAAIVTLYGVAPLIMARQLGRALGGDALGPRVLRRLTLPVLELYTRGLYTDESVLEATKEALARTTGPASDKGDQKPNADPDPPAGPAPP